MGKTRIKTNYLIAASAVALLAGIVWLGCNQYEANKKAYLSHFKEHLFLHANHISDRLENLLSSYQRALEIIPLLSSDPMKDVERVKMEMQAFSGRLVNDFITEISFCDEEGITIYSTKRASIGACVFDSPFFAWAKNPESGGKLFISTDIRNARWNEPGTTDNPPKRFKLILAAPIHDYAPYEEPSHRNGKFRGVFLFSIDLRDYIISHLEDDLLKSADAWIVDSDGLLLFHTDHPEMLGLNLRQPEEPWIQSHYLHRCLGEILEKEEGTIDCDAKGASRTLLAFAPLKFQDLSLVVVFSSDYESVSAFVRKGLKETILLLSAVVFSFALGFAYLMHSSRVKVRAEEESKHWRILMEERNQAEVSLKRSAEQQQHLSSRLLTTQEEERHRISKELHDGLGGALVTLKLRETLLKKNLKADQEAQIKECEKTIEYIDEIVEEVYRLIRDLTPSVLEHLGLSAAIKEFANDRSKTKGLEVTVNATNIDAVFSRETQTAIYRIFQEAFTNMDKHAHASSAAVAVRENENEVSFVIKDNGGGFDLEKVNSRKSREKGLGLTTMEERVKMLGGDFEIRSEKGKGTRISFRIPKTNRV